MFARRFATLVIWTAAGGMLAFAGYALRRHAAIEPRSPSSPTLPSAPPSYDAPQQQVIAEAWDNGVLPIRWTIRNTGGSDLIIDDIRLGCACSGLFLERAEGGLEPVTRLRVAPQAAQEVHWPLLVRGRIETEMVYRVYFRTNDPRHPVASFRVEVKRVRGDLRLRAAADLFTAAPVGEEQEGLVDLLVDSRSPERVVKLEASREWCVVERLPTPDEVVDEERLLARVRLKVKPEAAGVHDLDLVVATDSGRVRKFPIVMRAVDHVECWPKVVVLPRVHQEQRLWKQQVHLQSRAKKPVRVRDLVAPDGVGVQVVEKDGSTSLLIDVEAKARGRGELWVQGWAETGDKSSQFRIRILAGDR